MPGCETLKIYILKKKIKELIIKFAKYNKGENI